MNGTLVSLSFCTMETGCTELHVAALRHRETASGREGRREAVDQRVVAEDHVAAERARGGDRRRLALPRRGCRVLLLAPDSVPPACGPAGDRRAVDDHEVAVEPVLRPQHRGLEPVGQADGVGAVRVEILVRAGAPCSDRDPPNHEARYDRYQREQQATTHTPLP